MNRRTFNKLVGLGSLGALAGGAEGVGQVPSASVPAQPGLGDGQKSSQEWKSGQGSPVHDADDLYEMGPRAIVLENEHLYVAFDERTGALTEFRSKSSGWKWQTEGRLGESFLLFVPTHERSYEPVLGVRNVLTSFQKSADGKTVELVWANLKSEYEGVLDITLRGTVRLDEDTASFNMVTTNHSPNTISSLSWPILGSVAEPAAVMKVSSPTYGGLPSSPLWNPPSQSEGYYGTDYPTRLVNGRYVLVATPAQGLYAGAHNQDDKENVKWMFELKPGFKEDYANSNPLGTEISGHPVRLTMRAVHYPFLNPGESGALAPIVLGAYAGDWHAGTDIYKRWVKTWYRALPMPAWAGDVHSWQQLQINSAEDDLRTRYADLPGRVAQAARNGITALQLVGWSVGGQDRDNPSDDTDARLGTATELKEAIAKIQQMGVHVVLFAKYAWADTTTEWFKQTLYKYMASDPYGTIYRWEGYRYQTPEQLAGINPRNFATGCGNDADWREVLAKEFHKVVDLGAHGVLFDEAQHLHSAGYNLCFNPRHGHHVPASISSGDVALSEMYRKIVRESVGEERFLFSGEAPGDAFGGAFSLTYIRITPAHLPHERYVFPYRPIMIAATGFDDREMINRALMYRYIVSYEPFNFKGDVDDFPLTIEYGKKMDALRKRYKEYLWDAEFRDTLAAKVSVEGKAHRDYTAFVRKDGKRAVVVANVHAGSIEATIRLDGAAGPLMSASPENPEGVACGSTIAVPARSVAVVMEG